MRGPTLLFLVLLTSCDGSILGTRRPTGSPEAPAGTGGGSPTIVTPGQPQVAPPRFACTAPAAAGTTNGPLRRLTRDELINTWSDLLGAAASDAAVRATLLGLPDDALQSLSTVADDVPQTWAAVLASAAKKAVPLLLANASERARLLGACTTQALTEACVRSVVSTFGARVWRRPLATAEVDALTGFWSQLGGGETGLGFLLRRLLQSPPLVFHFEDGGAAEGSRLRLSSYEVAARVSYLVTGSMPDDALWAAAGAGELETIDQAKAQVARLLDTPRGRARVRDLFRYYLRLSEAPVPNAAVVARHGVAPDGLGQAIVDEALDFSERVFWNGADGSFRELMTSTRSAPKDARLVTVLGGTCATPASTHLAWNDAAVFWHADGASPAAPVQTLTTTGWFVWQIPAGRLGDVRGLRLTLDVQSDDGSPVALQLNLDDVTALGGLSLPVGAQVVQAPVTRAAGAALKVGLYVANAGAGRSVTVRGLDLDGAPTRCGEVDSPSHPGLLHRPAVLVSPGVRTSPILRGAHVRKQFLCAHLPTPDPTLVKARQDAVGDLEAMPNRAKADRLTNDRTCSGCHSQLNPLGFTFEGFDQLGMPRAQEEVLAMDGTVAATWPLDTAVTAPLLDLVGGVDALADSAQLAAAMAKSPTAQGCFAEVVFEYVHRRAGDDAKDGCALSAAETLVAGGSLKDAVVSLVANDDLFFRSAP